MKYIKLAKLTMLPFFLLLVFGACNKNASYDETKAAFNEDAVARQYISTEIKLNKQLTGKVTQSMTDGSVKQYLEKKKNSDKATAIQAFKDEHGIDAFSSTVFEAKRENALLYIQLYIKYVKKIGVPKALFSSWIKEALTGQQLAKS
jgi:hypothetical protein